MPGTAARGSRLPDSRTCRPARLVMEEVSGCARRVGLASSVRCGSPFAWKSSIPKIRRLNWSGLFRCRSRISYRSGTGAYTGRLASAFQGRAMTTWASKKLRIALKVCLPSGPETGTPVTRIRVVAMIQSVSSASVCWMNEVLPTEAKGGEEPLRGTTAPGSFIDAPQIGHHFGCT